MKYQIEVHTNGGKGVTPTGIRLRFQCGSQYQDLIAQPKPEVCDPEHLHGICEFLSRVLEGYKGGDPPLPDTLDKLKDRLSIDRGPGSTKLAVCGIEKMMEAESCQE